MLYPLTLLATGSSLQLCAQALINLAVIDPSSQLIAWDKYFINFLISCVITLLGHSANRKAVASTKPGQVKQQPQQQGARRPGHKGIRAAIGYTDTMPASFLPAALQAQPRSPCRLMDVFAYSLFTMGFVKCGSSVTT